MNLKNSVDNDFLQLKIPDAVVLWRKTQLPCFSCLAVPKLVLVENFQRDLT